MPEFRSPIISEAAQRVKHDRLYYRPRLFASRRARANAEAKTIRVRLAKLIVAAVKYWPTYETMSCCKWYLDEAGEWWNSVVCDDDLADDITSYGTLLQGLINDYEQANGEVDSMYFGRLVTLQGRTSYGMPANLAFLYGPASYAWTGDRFSDYLSETDPEYPLAEFAYYIN
jgi:hypothetical protein